MSRTHDRAYAALAERMRLARPARHALYAIVALLVGSGLAWLAAHDALVDVPAWRDDLARLAFESVAMKVHAAVGVAALVALGMMLAHHARRGLVLARYRTRSRWADGTSRQEMAPAFFQPSLSSQVLGWRTNSGS